MINKNDQVVVSEKLTDEMEIVMTIFSPILEDVGSLVMGENMN